MCVCVLCSQVCQLQRLFFKHWPTLRDLSLSNCGTVENRDTLRGALKGLSDDDLHLLVVTQLRLVPADDPWAADRKFLTEVRVCVCVCLCVCVCVQGASVHQLCAHPVSLCPAQRPFIRPVDCNSRLRRRYGKGT